MINILIKKIEVGTNRSNCYLVGENDGKITVIDAGAEGEKIMAKVEKISGEVEKIINTHGHFDHIGANKFIKDNSDGDLMIHKNEKNFLQDPQKNFSFWMDSEDIVSPPADFFLEDKEQIKICGYKFKVILTPGHSPGGITLYCAQEKIAFCGDTIFKTGIGRTDIPGSDRSELKNTIETKLLQLPDDTILFPGHGKKTSLGEFREQVWEDMKEMI